MKPPPTPWRTAEEAAARAKLSTKVIYAAVKAEQNRLRAAVVGGRRALRFRDEWVDAWLEASAPQDIEP